ncbi:MAG: Rieske (2Fe-2S) protein [Proteobacteria bacterium]|nr:Rieske (2Fe-2S) protein [Pseudomonadota bacterium]
MSSPVWRDLAPLSELPDGKLTGFAPEGLPLCVARRGDRVYALDDTCPHAGGSLSKGLLTREGVICPLHAYAFALETGRCDDDPTCSVTSYPVRVQGGVVQVALDAPDTLGGTRP